MAEFLALIGPIYAGLTCLMVIMVPGAWVMTNGTRRLWAWPAWAGLAALEGWTVVAVWKAADDGYDPPGAAGRLPRGPRLLRPLLAAWYLAHFLMAAATAAILQAIVGDTVEVARTLVGAWTFVALGLTIIYSANLYGLLAMTTAGFGMKVVRQAWRFRIGVDLAVAVLAAIAPLRFNFTRGQPPVVHTQPHRSGATSYSSM